MAYPVGWYPRLVVFRDFETATDAEILESNRNVYGDPRFPPLRSFLVLLRRISSLCWAS